jgi:hypothetical protein
MMLSMFVLMDVDTAFLQIRNRDVECLEACWIAQIGTTCRTFS